MSATRLTQKQFAEYCSPNVGTVQICSLFQPSEEPAVGSFALSLKVKGFLVSFRNTTSSPTLNQPRCLTVRSIEILYISKGTTWC
jgi:hypothetical protein